MASVVPYLSVLSCPRNVRRHRSLFLPALLFPEKERFRGVKFRTDMYLWEYRVCRVSVSRRGWRGIDAYCLYLQRRRLTGRVTLSMCVICVGPRGLLGPRILAWKLIVLYAWLWLMPETYDTRCVLLYVRHAV